MHPLPTALALLAIAALPVLGQDAPPPANGVVAGTYALDPGHSQILFAYDHLGFSMSTGMVRGVTGTVMLDPAVPSRSSVEAAFPLSALMTASTGLDQALRGPDFFDAADLATAVTFRSTVVTPTGERSATVTGELTLNGVTRPVTLNVTLRAAGEHPVSKLPAAGFEATATLRRSEFNLGAFVPAVGDEVRITISAEAQKG